MKVVLALLLFLVTVSVTSAAFFRVANHLGTNAPKGIKFKQCGLGNVYVNGKDTSRLGFGVDLPTASLELNGICGDDDKKREVDSEHPENFYEELSKLPIDSDEVEDFEARGVAGAVVAADAVANMHVYWNKDGDTYTEANRILLRVRLSLLVGHCSAHFGLLLLFFRSLMAV
jgi:hypothetical protein